MSSNKETIEMLHAQLKAGGSSISLQRLREILRKELTKEELEAELKRKEKTESAP